MLPGSPIQIRRAEPPPKDPETGLQTFVLRIVLFSADFADIHAESGGLSVVFACNCAVFRALAVVQSEHSAAHSCPAVFVSVSRRRPCAAAMLTATPSAFSEYKSLRFPADLRPRAATQYVLNQVPSYQMVGTDGRMGLHAQYAMSGTVVACGSIVLCACYGMSSTEERMVVPGPRQAVVQRAEEKNAGYELSPVQRSETPEPTICVQPTSYPYKRSLSKLTSSGANWYGLRAVRY